MRGSQSLRRLKAPDPRETSSLGRAAWGSHVLVTCLQSARAHPNPRICCTREVVSSGSSSIESASGQVLGHANSNCGGWTKTLHSHNFHPIWCRSPFLSIHEHWLAPTPRERADKRAPSMARSRSASLAAAEGVPCAPGAGARRSPDLALGLCVCLQIGVPKMDGFLFGFFLKPKQRD